MMSGDEKAGHFDGFQNHQLARLVARVAKIGVEHSAAMAEGMWNPSYCTSNAKWRASYLAYQLQEVLDDIERLTAKQNAAEEAP